MVKLIKMFYFIAFFGGIMILVVNQAINTRKYLRRCRVANLNESNIK